MALIEVLKVIEIKDIYDLSIIYTIYKEDRSRLIKTYSRNCQNIYSVNNISQADIFWQSIAKIYLRSTISLRLLFGNQVSITFGQQYLLGYYLAIKCQLLSVNNGNQLSITFNYLLSTMTINCQLHSVNNISQATIWDLQSLIFRS